MIKQRPSLGRVLVMVAFALSCFGILIFLWLSFGGSVPLKPQGYRVEADFPEATQLAQQADVRISGVKVGTVAAKEPDRRTGLTRATLQIDSQYAPLPSDARAILRQKTLLGETYVELSPGSHGAPKLRDGGEISRARIAPTVELDEILRAFDPRTRRSFQIWLDEQGRAVSQRGRDLNTALGELEPLAQDTDRVLKVLRSQSGDTKALVRDTGAVFDALSERRGQLRGLVTNSNRVFSTTARRNSELAQTFQALPTFLRESRSTVRRVSRFADATNPLITQLRPAARELSPTLVQLSRTAPDLRGLFKDIGPLVRVSLRGLPAFERILDDSGPLLAALDPFLRTLIPVTDYLGFYKKEIAAFFANDTAATQAVDTTTTPPLHYLRVTNPVNPEVLAAYPRRLPSNRSNPYVQPSGYAGLASGLSVFGNYLCAGGTTPPPPVAGPNLSKELATLIKRFVYADGADPAPPCKAQVPLGSLLDQPRLYPRLDALPKGTR